MALAANNSSENIDLPKVGGSFSLPDCCIVLSMKIHKCVQFAKTNYVITQQEISYKFYKFYNTK